MRMQGEKGTVIGEKSMKNGYPQNNSNTDVVFPVINNIDDEALCYILFTDRKIVV